MKKTLLLLILCLFAASIQAQKEQVYQNESKTHIGWQPDRRLTKDDYQGDFNNDPRHQKYCDEVGLCVSAATGVFFIGLMREKEGISLASIMRSSMFLLFFQKEHFFMLFFHRRFLGFCKTTINGGLILTELTARYMKYRFHHFLDSFNLHCDNECTFFFLSFYEEAMAHS